MRALIIAQGAWIVVSLARMGFRYHASARPSRPAVHEKWEAAHAKPWDRLWFIRAAAENITVFNGAPTDRQGRQRKWKRIP